MHRVNSAKAWRLQAVLGGLLSTPNSACWEKRQTNLPCAKWGPVQAEYRISYKSLAPLVLGAAWRASCCLSVHLVSSTVCSHTCVQTNDQITCISRKHLSVRREDGGRNTRGLCPRPQNAAMDDCHPWLDRLDLLGHPWHGWPFDSWRLPR